MASKQINCLRNGDTARQFLKNCKPKSLLCAVHKLASGVLAERMKPYLDNLISKTQTGYIKGQYIGESRCSVYDLMNFTEKHKSQG